MPRFFTPLVLLAVATVALPACSSPSKASPSTDPSSIAFNEISAAGDEWLELYNAGQAELDLSSYAVADSDKTTGAPRSSKAMRFPLGTKLAKGAFSLILLGKSNSTPGPYAAEACLPGVSVGCFYALFSISESRGEAIHLLGPDDSLLSSVIYPADLTFEAGSNLTACRLPDGAGDLTTCAATPGASNAAP